MANWRPLKLSEICDGAGKEENKAEEKEEEDLESKKGESLAADNNIMDGANFGSDKKKKRKNVQEIFSQIAAVPTLRVRVR